MPTLYASESRARPHSLVMIAARHQVARIEQGHSAALLCMAAVVVSRFRAARLIARVASSWDLSMVFPCGDGADDSPGTLAGARDVQALPVRAQAAPVSGHKARGRLQRGGHGFGALVRRVAADRCGKLGQGQPGTPAHEVAACCDGMADQFVFVGLWLRWSWS
ncbi:hypothetical protein [Ralstonia insidiosa]|uniref:hypothetical protein n=1 Tax=Ralstonia insidiosa TaxID=190721 RepID=UPI003D6473BE